MFCNIPNTCAEHVGNMNALHFTPVTITKTASVKISIENVNTFSVCCTLVVKYNIEIMYCTNDVRIDLKCQECIQNAH